MASPVRHARSAELDELISRSSKIYKQIEEEALDIKIAAQMLRSLSVMNTSLRTEESLTRTLRGPGGKIKA
jgi:hypothetical protein